MLNESYRNFKSLPGLLPIEIRLGQRAINIAMERYDYPAMKNPCLRDSKSSVICCPGDEKLRKEWLLTLEDEHESLKGASTEIAGKFKIFSNILFF